MRSSTRLSQLPPYAFAEIDRLRDERLAQGVDVIDFGVGDPTDPVPDAVVLAAQRGLERHRRSGYPSYVGSRDFRTAVADWMQRRFGVLLDTEQAITATIGSKEAVFHLAEAFLDPGDVALVPSPGYPPYSTGARFAEGRVETYAVTSEGAALPDLDALPAEVGDRLRVVWITQPHVPVGRCASLDALARLRAQVVERDILLCSDEAYSELWMNEPCASVLQTGVENTLVFQSLSKHSCMTGFRVGFVAGDHRAVSLFRQLKTNIDSGTPHFVQDAAAAALDDQTPAAEARARYRERAEVLIPALEAVGCGVTVPEAGFYLWVKVPGAGSGVTFAKRLLGEAPAVLAMPGEWLAEPVRGRSGTPGDGRVRLALVPSLERCRTAADRLRAWSP